MIFVLFALMLQLRRRRDIADRSLGDFQIKVAFLSKCDVAATSQLGHMASFMKNVTCHMAISLRLLCDVAMGSQIGSLATFISKSHSYANAMSLRHRNGVAWRLYTKCHIFTSRPSCDPFAMSQLGRLAIFIFAMSLRLSFLTGKVYMFV